MANIGGNINGVIQTRTTLLDETGRVVKNAIGESENAWAEAFQQIGWLGLQSGGKSRDKFLAKIEESTHVFLCDYHPGIYALADQDTRLIAKGVVYDILLIDNPDEMDEQLEIYLKRVGAWDGK